MNEELKPCSFCGTKAVIRKVSLLNDSYLNDRYGYKDCYEYRVRCPKCGCRISMRNTDTVIRTDREAKQNAIEAWNRRAE